MSVCNGLWNTKDLSKITDNKGTQRFLRHDRKFKKLVNNRDTFRVFYLEVFSSNHWLNFIHNQVHSCHQVNFKANLMLVHQKIYCFIHRHVIHFWKAPVNLKFDDNLKILEKKITQPPWKPHKKSKKQNKSIFHTLT